MRYVWIFCAMQVSCTKVLCKCNCKPVFCEVFLCLNSVLKCYMLSNYHHVNWITLLSLEPRLTLSQTWSLSLSRWEITQRKDKSEYQKYLELRYLKCMHNVKLHCYSSLKHYICETFKTRSIDLASLICVLFHLQTLQQQLAASPPAASTSTPVAPAASGAPTPVTTTTGAGGGGAGASQQKESVQERAKRLREKMEAVHRQKEAKKEGVRTMDIIKLWIRNSLYTYADDSCPSSQWWR